MLHKNALKKSKHFPLFLKGLQIRYFIETLTRTAQTFFLFFFRIKHYTKNPSTQDLQAFSPIYFVFLFRPYMFYPEFCNCKRLQVIFSNN